MSARNLMVVGTASSAGKSLMVTALCRIFKNHGFSVAPFKSQNMSLNSFVTPEGHEMGRAQVSQAEAAGLTPSALMNPILLKPTTNQKSQVIVNGKVYGNMSAVEYYEFKDNLRPQVKAAYDALAARHDLVIIEGAGSPAEINLMDNDFVNMGMAAMVEAPVLLVGDIDRGGVFAALYGTVKLLPPEDQARIKGLIVNKFRGDVKILEPGLRQIESLLDIPVLGVIPYGKFAIDEEDSLTDRLSAKSSGAAVNIAVLRLPRISNFTDFAVFDTLPDVSLNYVDDPAGLTGADMIIIPGSKNTIEDMLHLQETGLAERIRGLAEEGRVIVGICGGFQILGKTIHDPHGVESSLPSIDGLGLLDVETSFAADKHTTQSCMKLRSGSGPLSGADGLVLEGYEIHMGETVAGPEADILSDGGAEGGPFGASGFGGRVLGCYLHGFFDNLEFTRRLLDNIRRAKGLSAGGEAAAGTYQQLKEKEYDRLAEMVEKHLSFDRLLEISGLK